MRAIVLIVMCGVVAGCGCLGYRLGTTLPPGIKSVFIPIFSNSTREPQIEIRTTSVAIQEFRKDGSLSVTDAEHADARLEVTLIGYELIPLRYERERAKAGSEYRLILTARVLFREIATGKLLAETESVGETTFLLAGDIASAKATALPDAARDLAHQIVESVVEYWP